MARATAHRVIVVSRSVTARLSATDVSPVGVKAKAFEISGPNGTYLELEDGRSADSVRGKEAEVETLRANVTCYVDRPFSSYWAFGDLRAYAGFINETRRH